MTRAQILTSLRGNDIGLDKNHALIVNQRNGGQLVFDVDSSGRPLMSTSLNTSAVNTQLILPGLSGDQYNAGGILTGPKAAKIRRVLKAAMAFNPVVAAAATDVPTLGTTHDATLTYTNCDPSQTATAAKMNLLGGTWTKDGANNRWIAICDTVTSGTHGAVSIVEFCTDAPKVEFKVSGGPLYVEVDGYALDKTTTGVPVGGSGGSGSVVATIDYTAGTNVMPRHWRMWTNNLNYVYSVGVGSAYRMWAPLRDDIVKCYIEGDSYVAGTASSGVATFTTLPNLMMAGQACLRLGFRDFCMGAEGGTGYIANSGGTKTTYVQRASNIVTQNPDVVVIFGSINDNNQGQAAVYAAALPYLQSLRTSLPYVPIIVVGAQAGSTGPSAALLAVEAGIKQAVDYVNAAGDWLTIFVPCSSETLPWGDSNNQSTYIGTSDNTHPTTPLGHAYYGNRLAHGIVYALGRMLGNS